MHFLFRKLVLLVTLQCVIPHAQAQYSVVVVGDPIAQANHSEDIAKWIESIQKLNTQIDQMNQYIQIAQTMKGYIGDPASAAGAVGLDLLGNNSLGSSVGQLTGALNQTANGAQALQYNGQGLFQSVPTETPGGFSMSFNADLFKSYGAIQNHTANAANVMTDTVARIRQLQQDKATTLAQLKSATTQSETQKLQAKLSAIDGEIAALGQQQEAANGQLVAQDIANRNDRQMQAQAANQAADHELSVSLENYSQWQGQITRSQTPFK